MNAIEEVIYNYKGVINDLKEQIARLNKEADWLAERLRGWECSELRRVPHNGLCRTDHEDCIGCWREAARKAVLDV